MPVRRAKLRREPCEALAAHLEPEPLRPPRPSSQIRTIDCMNRRDFPGGSGNGRRGGAGAGVAGTGPRRRTSRGACADGCGGPRLLGQRGDAARRSGADASSPTGRSRRGCRSSRPPGAERRDVTHLEAVGRLLAGIAPWLELPADDDAPRARCAREYAELRAGRSPPRSIPRRPTS